MVAMGDHEQADATAHPREVDPYDIGAGAQIGQEKDSDPDGLTDAFEKLANISTMQTESDGDQLSDIEEMSPGTNPLSVDSNVDGITDGPEVSYQSDPLSDIHSGPWNQGLPAGVPGPQPDQSGFGGAHPGQGSLGGPHPDQGAVDPAGSDHLDNAGGLDFN
jgi:hypothetical protein